MKFFGFLCVVFSGLQGVLGRNKAVLINCSFQYENYRHTANVLALQTLLQKNGYLPEDISVFLRDDILEDLRNPIKQVCIGDALVEPHTDYTPKKRSSSYFDILNMISGSDCVMEGSDKNTNLLIYITGHGGDGFIKYCNREYFYRDDLTNALLRLQEVRRLGKVLFIADTCQADTLIDSTSLPNNVFFVSTSLKGESSHSANFDSALNIYPIDLFVFHLYQQERRGRLRSEKGFRSLSASLFPSSLLLSTVSVHRDFSISDFLYQKDTPLSLYL